MPVILAPKVRVPQAPIVIDLLLTLPPVDVDEAFAARMHEVCEDLGIPERGRQTALAKLFGLTPNAARKWLLGEGMPELSLAVKIAQRAEVSVLWLLQGVLPKRPGRVEVRALLLDEILDALKPASRDELLGYLRFRVSDQFGPTSPRTARYLRAIDSWRDGPNGKRQKPGA